MFKILQKVSYLFFAFLLAGQGFSGQIGQLVGSAKADESLPVTVLKVNNPSGEVAPDSDITYTITITNQGDTTVGPMTLTDIWYDEDGVATFVSADLGGIGDNIAKTVVWNNINLVAYESLTFTFKLHTNPTNLSGGTFTVSDQANLSMVNFIPTFSDFISNTVTYIATDPTDKFLPVTISKVSNPVGEVAPDSDITYTITVANTGETVIGPLVLTDNWFFGSDVVATYVDGSANLGGVGDNANGTVVWNIDNLGVGASLDFIFRLHTNSTNQNEGTFTISDQAVLSDGTSIPATSEISNTVTYTAVAPVAHLAISKAAQPLTVAPGQSVNYTIQVNNPGTAAATDVVIIDVLPEGFSYIPNSAELGGVATEPVINGNQLEWTISSLLAGQNLGLVYGVKVDSAVVTGLYQNLATVSAENVEEEPQAQTEVSVVKVVVLPQVLGASTSPVVTPASTSTDTDVLPETGANTSTSDTILALMASFALLLIMGFVSEINRKYKIA